MTEGNDDTGADTGKGSKRAVPEVREAHDADNLTVLKDDPSHEDAKADIALDESFPTSDAPGHTTGSSEPAPSSCFNEETERKIVEQRERAYALWEREGRPEGRHHDHWRQSEAPEPGADPWVEGP